MCNNVVHMETIIRISSIARDKNSTRSISTNCYGKGKQVTWCYECLLMPESLNYAHDYWLNGVPTMKYCLKMINTMLCECATHIWANVNMASIKTIILVKYKICFSFARTGCIREDSKMKYDLFQNRKFLANIFHDSTHVIFLISISIPLLICQIISIFCRCTTENNNT